MTTTVELVTAALGGSSSQLLKDLTNQSGSASSIDSTVLASACSMAEGKFRTETGIAPDADKDWHAEALIACSLYALELLKGRDSNMIRTRQTAAWSACKSIRDKATMLPTTSSVLAAVPETSGQKADLDRDGFVGGLTDGVRPNAGITDYSPDDDA